MRTRRCGCGSRRGARSLPKIDKLDDPRYFPYRYGHALWAYIGGRFGDEVIGDMLRAGGASRAGYDAAFEGVLQVETKELSKEWHDALFQAYLPIAETTKMPGAIARPVITKRREGEMNVSPELSPDGSKVIFFSERDLFSIDLYVADAKTGEVLRKVTDTATSAHTESLQFISSAGSWDRTSKKFVFPGIARGHSVLTIVDVERGKKEREITVEGVDEVTNPTWSPDGNTIAFSGLVGGFTDLFLYDLNGGQLKRLTTDQFAELDPSWSPDGKTLAFSTDRFTTNLQTLVVGDLRLAVLDVASGAVKPAGGFEQAKNISPQWTADGRALYFVSDRGGISNIYRMEFGGATTQLTNLLTGASGITELSPALSVAEGRLVFSALRRQRLHDLRAGNGRSSSPGARCRTLPINAAVLPPRKAGAGPVYAAVTNETLGIAARERGGGSGRGIQAQARSRFRRAARGGRRRGSVRHLRRRRRVVRVQRHARQSLALHRRPGHQPLRRNRRKRHLHQPDAPLELGRGARPDAVCLSHVQDGRRVSAGGANLRRAGVPDPAGRPVIDGAALVSVQPRATHRLQRRRAPDRVLAGPDHPFVRLSDRASSCRRTRNRSQTSRI